MYYNGTTYNEYPINNGTNNLLTSRLESCYRLFNSVIDKTARILHQHHILRMPANYSVDFTDEEIMRRFMRKLGKLWNVKKRGKLNYMWCREVEKSKNCHIHMHTLVDEKRSTYSGVTELIKQAWKYALQPQNANNGLVHVTKFKTYKRSDSKQLLDEAFYWLSYICKLRDGTKNKGFNHSKIQ